MLTRIKPCIIFDEDSIPDIRKKINGCDCVIDIRTRTTPRPEDFTPKDKKPEKRSERVNVKHKIKVF